MLLKKNLPPKTHYQRIENRVSNGMCDTFLCHNGRSVFIELKTKTGRLTKYQQNWIDDLNERGYKAECCYGLEKALDLIDWYLNEKGK